MYINDRRYEVVVIGAGAAGSIAAYDLAKAGARVLLVEKEKLPRYKPCGGGLTEKAIKVLPFDPSSVIEDTVYRIALTFKLRDPVELRYPKPLVYTVMRDRFDMFLVEHALAAGARLLDGVEVKTLTQDGRLEVVTESGSIEASVVIGADGVNGVAARSQGLMGDVRHLVAWETELEPEAEPLSTWQGLIGLDMGTLPASYAWNFPKKDRLSVGAGGHSKIARRLKDYYAGFLGQQGIGPNRILSQRGYRLPLRKGNSPVYKGRVALAGDAAGLVDAFTGEGVYWALASGRLAASSALAVLGGSADSMEVYQRKIDVELMPELSHARRWLNVYLWWPGLCYRLLRRRSRFWDATARVLRGEKSYASIDNALGPLHFLAHRFPDPF